MRKCILPISLDQRNLTSKDFKQKLAEKNRKYCLAFIRRIMRDIALKKRKEFLHKFYCESISQPWVSPKKYAKYTFEVCL